jgi:hypothetical protein
MLAHGTQPSSSKVVAANMRLGLWAAAVAVLLIALGLWVVRRDSRWA